MSEGPWIETFTGKRFYPLSPRRGDVDIKDIAHALAYKCRYGGHSICFYSVAEHCVALACAVPREHAMAALLHDAAEAYLPDVFAPIKGHLAGFSDIERRVHDVIMEALWQPPGDLPPVVKECDKRILHNEREQLFPYSNNTWTIPGKPLKIRLPLWSPEAAEQEFLDMHWRLSLDPGDVERLEAAGNFRASRGRWSCLLV